MAPPAYQREGLFSFLCLFLPACAPKHMYRPENTATSVIIWQSQKYGDRRKNMFAAKKCLSSQKCWGFLHFNGPCGRSYRNGERLHAVLCGAFDFAAFSMGGSPVWGLCFGGSLCFSGGCGRFILIFRILFLRKFFIPPVYVLTPVNFSCIVWGNLAGVRQKGERTIWMKAFRR